MLGSIQNYRANYTGEFACAALILMATNGVAALTHAINPKSFGASHAVVISSLAAVIAGNFPCTEHTAILVGCAAIGVYFSDLRKEPETAILVPSACGSVIGSVVSKALNETHKVTFFASEAAIACSTVCLAIFKADQVYQAMIPPIVGMLTAWFCNI